MAWTREAALAALEGNDLLQLGMDADAVRRTLHGDDIATYAVLPSIVFVGSADTQPGELTRKAAAVLQTDAAHGAAELSLDLAFDLTHVLDATKLDPAVVDSIVDELAALHTCFPGLRLHGLSAGNVLRMAHTCGQSSTEMLQRLQAAGLASLNGAGSGMLRDLASDWIQVHRAAHALGLPTIAELVIGQGEELADRVSHLQALRALQRETGGFLALKISVHHMLAAEARREEEATAADYLKTLAISRLLVEEIEHVQGDWAVQGPKVLGLALRFGADDAGSIEPQQTAGREPRHHGGETELRRIIRDAGFRPVERDALFRQSILH